MAETVLVDGRSAIVGCIGAPAWHRIEFAYFWGAIPFKWRSPPAAVVEVPSEVQVWLEYRTGPTSWSTPTLEVRQRRSAEQNGVALGLIGIIVHVVAWWMLRRRAVARR